MAATCLFPDTAYPDPDPYNEFLFLVDGFYMPRNEDNVSEGNVAPKDLLVSSSNDGDRPQSPAAAPGMASPIQCSQGAEAPNQMAQPLTPITIVDGRSGYASDTLTTAAIGPPQSSSDDHGKAATTAPPGGEQGAGTPPGSPADDVTGPIRPSQDHEAATGATPCSLSPSDRDEGSDTHGVSPASREPSQAADPAPRASASTPEVIDLTEDDEVEAELTRPNTTHPTDDDENGASPVSRELSQTDAAGNCRKRKVYSTSAEENQGVEHEGQSEPSSPPKKRRTGRRRSLTVSPSKRSEVVFVSMVSLEARFNDDQRLYKWHKRSRLWKSSGSDTVLRSSIDPSSLVAVKLIADGGPVFTLKPESYWFEGSYWEHWKDGEGGELWEEREVEKLTMALGEMEAMLKDPDARQFVAHYVR